MPARHVVARNAVHSSESPGMSQNRLRRWESRDAAVNRDAKVSQGHGHHNSVSDKNWTTTTHRRTPEDWSLDGIQLQLTGLHRRWNLVYTDRQSTDASDCVGVARTSVPKHLDVVCVGVWVKMTMTDQQQQISSIQQKQNLFKDRTLWNSLKYHRRQSLINGHTAFGGLDMMRTN